MSYYAIGINKNNLIYIRERNVGPVACDFMGIGDDVVYDIMYNLITMTPSLFPDEQMAKAMLNQLIKNIECVSIYNQMLDVTDDPNDIKETFFKEDISKLKIFELIPKKVKEN